MDRYETARLVLVLGLAFVFLYFGVDKFVHPLIWQGWIPSWLNGDLGLSTAQWLQLIGGAEIAIGVLILQPITPLRKFGCLLAAVQLGAVFTQAGWNDVTIRDIGLLAMAIAIWFLA